MTTHVREVMGSNPRAVYWMDIFRIDLLKELSCLLEKTENKRIRGRGWPIFSKKYWNKNSPNFFPKVGHKIAIAVFSYKGKMLKIAQKVAKHLGHFCRKIAKI